MEQPVYIFVCMEPCASHCLQSSLVITGSVFSRILKERRGTSGTKQRRPLRGCELTIAHLYINRYPTSDAGPSHLVADSAIGFRGRWGTAVFGEMAAFATVEANRRRRTQTVKCVGGARQVRWGYRGAYTGME